jgi:hypothetical protein
MRHLNSFITTLLVSVFLVIPISASADDWNGYAAPSVHLSYNPYGQIRSFQNSVTVNESALGSYFMVAGWSQGYFGMQETADGAKQLIFSVWDNGTQLAQVVYKANGVTAQRFGGEGTGAQSFYPFNWNVGVKYDFKVTTSTSRNLTYYTGWFNKPNTGWIKLVTLSVPVNTVLLEGLYSFVEDFYRNNIGQEWNHNATFGPAYYINSNNRTTRITCAEFTNDGNTDPHINAGTTADNRWFLATGGTTTNVNAKVGSTLCVK